MLQSGGFGVVALDLADVPMRAVRRLPFTTWLRAQRLIEGRDTVGIVIAQEPIARSARGVTVRLTGDGSSAPTWSGAGDRSRLFTGFTLHPHVASAHRLGRDGPLRSEVAVMWVERVRSMFAGLSHRACGTIAGITAGIVRRGAAPTRGRLLTAL